MTDEANKALVRRLYEAISRGEVGALDDLLAADFVDHNPDPGQPPGRAGVKHGFRMLLAAFPDFRITVEDLIAEGDKVVARVTARGTQRGEFQGLPPRQTEVAITGIDIVRCAGGTCVERWGVFDSLGMLQQLGAVPPPPGR